MESTDSTFGIAPGTMARMLAIGEEGEQADVAAVSMALLHRHKSLLLEVDSGTVNSVTEVLGGHCPQFEHVNGMTLGELLEAGNVPLEAIEGVKRYAKRLSERHRQEPARTVVAVLYYAAVGRALLDHDEKITGHGFEHLATSYAELLRMEWVGPSLTNLFRRSKDLCEARASAKAE